MIRWRWPRCWFSHHTAIICGETRAYIACTKCGYVESAWPIIRPEREHRGRQQREQFWRQVAMSTPEPRLRRIK